MRFRGRVVGRRGLVVSLLLSCHPLPALAMTVLLTACAFLTGRRPVECLLVAVTVASGQLTIGWVNDVVDRDRDRRTGRTDKPVALGWVEPSTVLVATGCAVLVLVPLSLANGWAAGVAHLTLVLSAWAYNLYFKSTVLSWVPYAVGFGALPAFLSYGGLGAGLHGAPPTVAMTLLAALFGVGVNFLNALPDIEEDEATGVRHLPLLVARRTGAPLLMRISAVATGLVVVAIVVAGIAGGVRQ
jgi:4-hydroxybenzoate polyprenyltransferase